MSEPSRSFGFTGTRDVWTRPQVDAVREALLMLDVWGYRWMQNGDCLGSDWKAARIWQMMGRSVWLRPPTNDAYRAFIEAQMESEPRPYLDRNRDIVDHSELLLATPKEMTEQPKGGTWFTVRYARRQRRPIMIVLPDGTVHRENWPSDSGSDRNGIARNGNPLIAPCG